jgi:hypothetical protein
MKLLPALKSAAPAALIVASFVSFSALADTAPLKPVKQILTQERKQLIALGPKRVKKIAGIKFKPPFRIVNWSKSNNRRPKINNNQRPKVKSARAMATLVDGPVVANFKQLNELPRASGGSEWACLTEALYFEARSESFDGISAVAEVVINRKNSSKFPNSICAVVSQGVGGRPGCQFSYNCDGKPEVYQELKAYARVAKMAQLKLDGRLKKLTGGALFYHTTAVRPSWSKKFHRTVKVGVHVFYKPH